MRARELCPAASRESCRQGWQYFLISLLILGRALSLLNAWLGNPLNRAELNFIVFLVNFLVFGWIFRHFLWDSAVFARKHPVDCLFYAAVGVLGYDFWTSAVTALIMRVDPGFLNANNENLIALAGSSRTLMVISTVLLAPLAEECIYREMLFRTLLEKHVWLAFAVSAGTFALGHVVGYLGTLTPMETALSILQYLPAGVFLAWSYRRSGTFLSPLLMHTFINLRSVQQYF